jgi:hypothetical protein
MKYLLMLSLACLVFTSCKKNEDPSMYKVKFSVTGTSVNQFKFNTEGLPASTSVAVPFTGTRDTTVYVSLAQTLSLDTKADATTSSKLEGKIYVNDVLVASQVDEDTDKDGKTQVKLNYTIVAK